MHIIEPTQSKDDLYMKLKALYPDYSDADLREARENLERYLEFVWQAFERRRSTRIFDNNHRNSYDVNRKVESPTTNH